MSADKMREALNGLIRAYVNTLEIGRDRILSNGGECDTVEVMKASDPALRAAREALASQAAQGEAKPIGRIRRGPDYSYSLWCTAKELLALEPLPAEFPVYTVPPAPAVPDGMVLVPVMPTAEMIAAVIELGDKQTVRAPNPDGLDRWSERDVNVAPVWAALLAAVPESKS